MDLISRRQQAIADKRCMVRVRRTRGEGLLTAAVCPGCWHTRSGRRRILERFRARGVEVISRGDGLKGRYEKGEHAPGCPYGTERS